MTTSIQPATPKLAPVSRQRKFATIRTILALMLREMATTYGRSPGGYLWAVLEPIAGIALLTVVFSVGFRAPPMGVNFPIFYATGMVPFLFYSDLSSKMAQSINFSRPLLAYPSVTFVDALLARFFINTLTQIMVAYVIFTGILVIFETRATLDLGNIGLGFAMTIALALGVGTLNCYLITRFHLWMRIWAILNRPMFIISCIFFVFETIPQPYQDYLWYNPLVHVVGQVRSGFYPSYEAAYVSPLYVFGFSLVTMALGMVFLTRFHRNLLNN